MSAAVTLRDVARASDGPIIHDLVVATGVFHPNEIPVAVELLDVRMAKGASSGYDFLFAEMDQAVVGYACYGLNEMTESSWELYWIAVDPSRQGKGIGRTIMDEVHRRIALSGGGRICLDTSGRADYEPTRAFYLANGYREVARLDDYYAPGDAKVILQRDVDPV
ncbi:MAG: GNAT family N-acetyltransferase [Pseudomonadales bacterium]